MYSYTMLYTVRNGNLRPVANLQMYMYNVYMYMYDNGTII